MTIPSEQSPDMAAYDRVVGERYQVLETLGAGGMAVVYNAYDKHLERNVALKMILPSRQSTEMFLERFRVEARSLARLSHNNIVKVLDYGEENGVPFLVMDFIPGGTLKELTGRPIPYDRAAAFLAPVARALEYVHQHSIVHRDVKPSNILLTDRDAPMLSDFGVVRLIEEESQDAEALATGVGIGTPDYMSPEQGMGHPTDYRADIYSLGVVFFELITGQKPFTAETPMAVVIQHVTGEFPRPQSVGVQLPSLVEAVIRRAVAKDPAERFEDMGKFAAALEELARGPKMSERTLRRLLELPLTPAQQARRRTISRIVLPVTALVVLLALFGVAWQTGLWARMFPPQPTAVAAVQATAPGGAAVLPTQTVTPTPYPSSTPTRAVTPTIKPSPTLGLAPTATPTPETNLLPKLQGAFFEQPVALIDNTLPSSGELIGRFKLLGVWGIGASQQLLYDKAGEKIFQATSQGVFVYSAKDLSRLHFIPSYVWVEVIALTPDGSTLFVGLRNGITLLYDAVTYESKQALDYRAANDEHTIGKSAAPVKVIDFSRDSKYLAIGYQTGTLRLLDLATLTDVTTWYQHPTVSALFFSEDNRYLYSAKEEAVINVWDLSTGKISHTITMPSAISLMKGSPDGQWLWTAGSGGIISVISLVDEKILYNYPVIGKGITTLTISPEQKTLAVGLQNGEIQLYHYPTAEDLHKTQLTLAKMAAHPDAISSLAFAPDGKTLISSSFHEGMLLWNPVNGEKTGSLDLSRPAIVKLTFVNNNEWLLVERADHKVEIWLVKESRILATYDGLIPEGDIFLLNRYVVLAQEGKNLWEEGKFLLINYPEATLAHTLPGYHRGWMVRPSPDEKLLVAGTPQKALIMDTSTWQPLDFHGGPNSGCGQFYTPENHLISVIWEKGILFFMDDRIENLCALKANFAEPVALDPKGRLAIYKLNRDGKFWAWTNFDEDSFTDQNNYKTYQPQTWADDRFLSYTRDGSGYLWVSDDKLVMWGNESIVDDWAAFQYQGAASESTSQSQRLFALGSQFGTITIFGD